MTGRYCEPDRRFIANRPFLSQFSFFLYSTDGDTNSYSSTVPVTEEDIQKVG